MEHQQQQAMRSITLFVISVHAALIFWAWQTHESTPPPPKTVKLVATTIELNPQPYSRTRSAPTIPQENFDDVLLSQPDEIIAFEEEPIRSLPKLEQTAVKASPQEEIKIKPKKPEKKAVAVKPEKKPSPPKPQKTIAAAKPEKKSSPAKPAKTPPKETAVAQKPAVKPDPKKQALLKQAKERIANIQADLGKTTPRKELKVPEYHPQATFAAEEGLSGGELSYRDELASRLQLLLKLPETGKIQIKLTLSKTGKFVKLVVINSPNGLNKQYIEKSLPTLALPGFGDQFGGVNEHTFSITLTSDL